MSRFRVGDEITFNVRQYSGRHTGKVVDFFLCEKSNITKKVGYHYLVFIDRDGETVKHEVHESDIVLDTFDSFLMQLINKQK